MTLTNKACENAKPGPKPRKLTDSHGLYLHIHPNGSKYWRYRYRLHGEEKLLALGVYPFVSLAEAREERDKARKLVNAGIDPVARKRETRVLAKVNATNTFEAVAREWHENWKEGLSRGYPEKVMRFFEKDVFPPIGNRPITEITPPRTIRGAP